MAIAPTSDAILAVPYAIDGIELFNVELGLCDDFKAAMYSLFGTPRKEEVTDFVVSLIDLSGMFFGFAAADMYQDATTLLVFLIDMQQLQLQIGSWS